MLWPALDGPMILLYNLFFGGMLFICFIIKNPSVASRCSLDLLQGNSSQISD
jgi:hypothetical protein